MSILEELQTEKKFVGATLKELRKEYKENKTLNILNTYSRLLSKFNTTCKLIVELENKEKHDTELEEFLEQ